MYFIYLSVSKFKNLQNSTKGVEVSSQLLSWGVTIAKWGEVLNKLEWVAKLSKICLSKICQKSNFSTRDNSNIDILMGNHCIKCRTYWHSFTNNDQLYATFSYLQNK